MASAWCLRRSVIRSACSCPSFPDRRRICRWLAVEARHIRPVRDALAAARVAALFQIASFRCQEDLRVQASPPQSIWLARAPRRRLLESRIVPTFPGLLLSKALARSADRQGVCAAAGRNVSLACSDLGNSRVLISRRPLCQLLSWSRFTPVG